MFSEMSTKSLTFEEAIDQEYGPPDVQLPIGRGVDVADYIQYKGKYVHKQMACRLFINMAYKHKSFDQPQRYIGFTKINKKQMILNDSLLEPDIFTVGDLCLTLLRMETTLSLAILRCTTLFEHSTPHSALPRETLTSPQGDVCLSGQLLKLVYIPTSLHSEDCDLLGWMWTGGLELLQSVIRGTDQSTHKPLIIQVSGCLIEPVNPHVINADSITGIAPEDVEEINSYRKTWYLTHDVLVAAITLLWENILKIDYDLIAILSISKSSTFPYHCHNNTHFLISEAGTQQLNEEFSDGAVRRACPHCGEVPMHHMREHMGAHILRAMRGVSENIPLKSAIGNNMPCGFCGASGDSNCTVYMKVMSQR
ncbi:hypothetical protein ABKN59_008196 [Abortiporus biennis]